MDQQILQLRPKVYSQQLTAEPLLHQRHLLQCSQAPWPWGPVPAPANPLHAAVRPRLLPDTWKYKGKKTSPINWKMVCAHVLTTINIYLRTCHDMTWHEITLHCITLHRITRHYITLRHITSHRIASHRITSHHITSHHITLHYITYACVRACMDAWMHIILYCVNVMLGFVVFAMVQVR